MSAYVEVRRAGYGGCPSMTACCGRQISRAPISPTYVLSSSMTTSTIKAISSATSGLRNCLLRKDGRNSGYAGLGLARPSVSRRARFKRASARLG
jgi:hypothetical protein